jgi:N-methylhydantoinase A
MSTRIGVDVGGTFTDLVFYDDESGEVRVAKGPTTPHAPDEGIAAVVVEGVPQHRIGSAEFFLHGTTVGINALLERKGARVGLITTEGFRDVLEMRRGDRGAMYDMLWRPPEPLVRRRYRRGVPERVRADGTVETPLDVDAVASAAALFAEADVDSIAVVFINAYANPVHELEAERALRAAGFTGEISLSHRVSGEFREYERTSTTVVDAYVRPRVSQYFRRVRTRLGDEGFTGECLVTRSGSGAMTFAEAEERPFETVMSGPVAGAVGTGELCRELGIDRAITADVGGTSFDTCVIVDGRPQIKYEGSVVGMPLQTAWVDVRSIGAGGGSLAYVDVGGLLRVGPQSAGAVPGPVCYGRGGTQPTTTDAAAVLGMLGFGELASGLVLDIEAAADAVGTVGSQLGLDTDRTARGIMTIANAAMADEVRSITIEQGLDPREMTLVAFGGAGPLFASLLALELSVDQVVVPNHAGNFSAWGLLGQDVTRSAAVTRIGRLDDAGIGEANELLRRLSAELRERGAADTAAGEFSVEAALDLRYAGQEHTLTLSVVADEDGATPVPADEMRDRFRAEYEQTFGIRLEQDIEIVAVRSTTRRSLPRRAELQGGPAADRPAARGSLEAYSFTRDERVEFEVLDRGMLGAGERLEGPCIITEPTTTSYVDAGFSVECHASGALFMRREREV